MFSADLNSFSNKLLKEGREKLGLTMGIVSHIEEGNYELVAVSSEAEVFVAGETFPLEATYCRQVYKEKRTIALTEIDGCPGLKLHPLYDSMALEAYISSPIMVEGKVWGTVNFNCMVLRDHAFTEEERTFLENAALQIAQEIEKSPS